MAIVALIIGSLALVAATVSTVLAVKERKRSQERNAAYVETMRTVVQEHRTALESFLLEERKKLEARTAQQVAEAQMNVESRLSDLEGGVIPDHEKAKQAAKAVNDFSAGISGSLGFDPVEALKQSRKQDGDS